MVTADAANWHATVSGADLFDGIDHPVVNAAVRSCLTVIRGCPTAADPTVTLALTGGNLRFGIESVTAVAAGDGHLDVDAVLDVEFAAQRNTGMGPQRVHMLLHAVAAVQDHWSFSIAPPANR
jgi:hypothetical protein